MIWKTAHMMDVTADEGVMKMCRLSGAEIAQLAQKHLGSAGGDSAAITFGREVAKKSLMQAAALWPVFVAELEKFPISVAYDAGADTALGTYCTALKKLAQGHMQDEAESAGVVELSRTGEERQVDAPSSDVYQDALDHAAFYVEDHCVDREMHAEIISKLKRLALPMAGADDGSIRRAALEEALGLMPVVAKEHFQRTDLTEEFLNGLAYGAAAYAAEVKKMLNLERPGGAGSGEGTAETRMNSGSAGGADSRLIGINAPDPLPAIQLLRGPIVNAVRSGQLTPEYSNHLQRKLRRVERLATELTCAVAGFLRTSAEGGPHAEG